MDIFACLEIETELLSPALATHNLHDVIYHLLLLIKTSLTITAPAFQGCCEVKMSYRYTVLKRLPGTW